MSSSSFAVLLPRRGNVLEGSRTAPAVIVSVLTQQQMLSLMSHMDGGTEGQLVLSPFFIFYRLCFAE